MLPISLALRSGHTEGESQPGQPPALRARLAPFLPQRLNSRQLLHHAATPLALGIREHDVRVLGQNLNPHEPPTEFPPHMCAPHRS